MVTLKLFRPRSLVTLTMERADRVGGKNDNTIALIQKYKMSGRTFLPACRDKKMTFQISVHSSLKKTVNREPL